jgi:hypothetical protein
MLLDTQLMFDPAASAVTVTRVSTNVLDMGVARDMGAGDGHPVPQLTIITDGLFAAAGAATLQVQIQGSVDNATWFTIAESGSPGYSIAQLNSGTIFRIDLPVSAPNPIPRYYRLNYIVGTGPFTAGSLQAYLNLGRDDIFTYAKNYVA